MSEVNPKELPTFFDPKSLVRKGLCPVTKLKESSPIESHSLYYEQHGTGPEKILLIMGMNASSFGWYKQVEHFGGLHGDEYSVLVFDNRGVGNSDTPKGPYTTTAMAEDVIVLLDFIGWKDARSINVIGISLGGMIAQELAHRIPERIVSLTLCVTTARGGFSPWRGVLAITRLTFEKDPIKKIPIVLDLLYLQAYLNALVPNDPEGRHWRDIQADSYLRRVHITRPQTLLGALSQTWAGLTHSVSPSRLSQISSTIPKITIISGDQDDLVNPKESEYLAKHLKGSEYIRWEGTKHAVNAQDWDRFNAVIERVIREGRQILAGAGEWLS